MRKSWTWWVVFCVVVGVADAVLETALEAWMGHDLPWWGEGLAGSVIIGIAIGMLELPDEKKRTRGQAPGGKAEDRREDARAEEQ